MKLTIKKKWLLAGSLCLAAGLLAGTEMAAAATSSTLRTVRTAQNTSRVIALPGDAKAGKAVRAAASQPAAASIQHVRLTWKEQPSAVQYQVVILRSEQDDPSNIAVTKEQIFTNGVDIDLSRFGSEAGKFYWKVCALDYNGKAIGHFSKPRPITEGSEINPKAPKPTTQFDGMDYAPVYPVYSWVPLAGAKQHEVSVYRVASWGNSLVHTLSAGEYDVYEEGGFTTPGRYFWQVRSVDGAGNPTSEWSEKVFFEVKGPTPIAALGDSITHGGGAMSVPPGYLLYDWESYASVPVKNIGYSGNTTADMIERFERDILPFSPRVLIIMGGVNDFRGTVNGWTTVQNLQLMRDKCDAYGIIPVFLTATPINPSLMVKRAHIEAPPGDWQVHMQYINDWVMQQRYCIDVSTMLADSNGWLRANYTTDGLHPDYYGKKYIGERVGEYLNAHFAWITKKLTKKPIPQYGQ